MRTLQLADEVQYPYMSTEELRSGLLLDDSSLPVPSSLSTSRVVRVFPHEQSLLRLIAALPMDTNQGWMGRVYLRMEEEPEAATEAIAAAA